MMVVCANAIQVDVAREAVPSAQMSVGSIAKFSVCNPPSTPAPNPLAHKTLQSLL